MRATCRPKIDEQPIDSIGHCNLMGSVAQLFSNSQTRKRMGREALWRGGKGKAEICQACCQVNSLHTHTHTHPAGAEVWLINRHRDFFLANCGHRQATGHVAKQCGQQLRQRQRQLRRVLNLRVWQRFVLAAPRVAS